MRGVAFHAFRQNANMFYLTGITEPDVALVIRTTAADDDSSSHTMHLYMRPRDEETEMWSGYRTGLDAARRLFGADEVQDLDAMPHALRSMIKSARHVYFDGGGGAHQQQQQQQHVDAGDMAGSVAAAAIRSVLEREKVVGSTRTLANHIHKLRLIKSDAEIALMRRAGQITGRVFNEVMAHPRWTSEADLQAALRYGWVTHGGEREAYVPVVAGGPRATCIHYTQNDQLLDASELVLVDAGAEVGGYLTDVSRAWPVATAKFSEPQRDLYEAVLNVEKACIKMCTAASAHSLQTIHMESVELMKTELKQLHFNLVEGDVERYLYPHRVGHHIGLEIHDCSTQPGFGSLQANQTITIEPGCYVPNDEKWPKHFRGLALRIEDSIAVGQDVPTILSVEAVKEIVDIEALRSSSASSSS